MHVFISLTHGEIITSTRVRDIKTCNGNCTSCVREPWMPPLATKSKMAIFSMKVMVKVTRSLIVVSIKRVHLLSMHAKYEVYISYSSKFMAKVNIFNRAPSTIIGSLQLSALLIYRLEYWYGDSFVYLFICRHKQPCPRNLSVIFTSPYTHSKYSSRQKFGGTVYFGE